MPLSATAVSTAPHRPRRSWTSRDDSLLLRNRGARRVAGWLAFGLLTLGVTAGLASLLRPAPGPYLFFLSPSVAGDPQGADAAVGCDYHALRDGGYFRQTSNMRGSRQAAPQADELAELASCRPIDVVVVYVAGRALVDRDGKIALFPSEDADDQSAPLLLGDLLQRVRRCSAWRKLLVLDVMRPSANPVGGISAEEVAGRIPDELDATPDPHRFTLLSCSPGEMSLDSEVFHRTGFGYYFEQGIRGGADDFNDERVRDGRVTVRELARFLAERVDRWAQATQGVRQTPLLYGDRADFDLIAISARERDAYLDPIADLSLAQYPKWLTAAWQARDQLHSAGTAHRQPRLYRQFESAVLEAEMQWRSCGESQTVRQRLQTQLALLKKRIDQAEAAASPPPHSLAQYARAHHAADPNVAKQLAALLKKVQAIPPENPPAAAATQISAAVDKFGQDTAKTAPDDVAMAALDVLYRDPAPSPATIRLLDRVVSQRQPQPRYVETHLLRRLVELTSATSAADWPTDAVRLCLRTLRMSQQAECAERSFVWTAAPLTAAEQSRHNGDALLLSPGYAPLDDALHSLREAERGLQSVLAYQATLREAYNTLDEARLRLPQYTSYLDFEASAASSWSSAVDAACRLDDALAIDLTAAPPSPAKLQTSLERIRERAALLDAALAQLDRPWQQEHLDEICRRAKAGLDGAAAGRELRALLEAPWLAAETRIALWRELRDVDQRLHRRVVGWDAGILPEPAANDAATPLPEKEVAQHVARRIRWAIELLRLGGCSDSEVAALNKQAAESAASSRPMSARRKMIASISDAYAKLLQDSLRSSASPSAQARLAAIVPAESRVGAFDDSAGSPFVRLQHEFCEQRWKWLAAHYSYLSHDICGPAFNAEIARRYLALVDGGVEQPFLLIQAPDAIPTLSASHPVQIADAAWKLVAPQSPEGKQQDLTPAATVLSPTERLHVGVEELTASHGGELRLRFELDPAVENDSATPARGVMLQLEANGRMYHHAIALPALAAGPQLQILLSADAVNPTAPLARLRLRPAQDPQPYYLYVSNPTTADVEVVVDVSTAAQPSPPLKIPAGGVKRVEYPAKAPKPGQPLPQLGDADGNTSLAVRVLDAKSQQQLAQRRFPIDVVSPRQYARVTGAQFVPHESGKNRLTVTMRAFEMPPGPPCIVELGLSPDEIPGLEGVTSGLLRGELPADGSPLVLVAENMLLADGYPEPGVFLLDVDGVPRTFRFAATFSRRGDPTTPREVLQPRVKLTAEAYAESAPGFPVAVHVENAADGSRLQLQLGKMQGGVFTPDLTRVSNRTRIPHVGFNPGGPAGALQFFVTLDDWRVDLDTTGIVGRRQLRAQLFDPLGAVSRVAVQDVILDDTPPRGVAFVQAPVQALVNKPIDITVQAIDDISGVKKANVFLGKPQDGKPPDGAKLIPARPLNRDGTQWQAQLPSQKEAGPIDVTAQVTNRVGLSSYVTTSITILAQAPAAGGDSSIKGRLLEGDRPQPGLPVTLKDAGGGVKGTATTDAQGKFLFDKLKPGKYTVSAVKDSSQRKGQADVEVQAGQTAEVSISLAL